MKLCNKCLVEQPLINFFIAKRNKDGTCSYRSECKSCHNKGGKTRYHDSEILKIKKYKRDKKWRKANPEKVKKFRFRRRIKASICAKKRCSELTDGYVRHLLTRNTTLKEKDVPQEMVELKRLNLQIIRYVKEIP